ncbi:MAG: general secretion pathway protein GspL [Betaproteobacteria bacterium]|nr:general secretion pathway protein GspL [Betaproteobacteria bacterium]NCP80917.1 general secretion pathway protein GspL [Rhodoferax sp.]NCS59926.1 general secretion pathway protein GspL [Rhodoferax sp.]
MTSLTITLPLPGTDAALFEYVLSSDDGLSVSAHACVPLALLPTARGEVVALVPAQALSWHQVKLPAGSVPRGWASERGNTRLRSILDGVLEDQLLDDPAQLHLALQPQAVSETLVWVAACDRTWLKSSLNALAQAGQAVGRIVPELTPQALADTVLVSGDADHPWVAGLQRRPAASGSQHADTASAAEEPANLLVCALNASAMTLLKASEDDSMAGQTFPLLLAEPAVAALAEAAFKRPVALQARAERLLQAAQSPWDMAQFDLAHASRDRRWARVTQALASGWHAPQWRAARLSVLALVLVNLVGLNAWAWREQAALNAQRAALRTVLLQTFPKVPVVVDAPLQMAREVAALQRASGTASGTDMDMENILAAFTAVAQKEYVAIAIEYIANEVRLKGPAVADTAALTAQLKAAGLRASAQGDQWLLSVGVQP